MEKPTGTAAGSKQRRPDPNVAAKQTTAVFDLDAIAHAAAASRSFVLAGLLLATLVVIGTLLATRLAIPATQTFQLGLRFVFPEAAQSLYPNESNFAIQDVIAPDIVARVHAQNDLDTYGVSLDKFASSISVAPYALDRNLIIDRFAKRLESPKISFVERERVEKNLRKELEATAGKTGVLMLVLESRFGLSEALGRKLLRDTVETWSTVRVSDYGVLQLPEAQRSADFIDVAKLTEINGVVAASQLAAFATNLGRTLERLKGSDGARSIRDPQSGNTVGSLVDQLYQYEQFALPQLFIRSTEAISEAERKKGLRVLRQRVAAFTRQEELARGRADAIAKTLQARGTTAQSETATTSTQAGRAGSNANGNLTPQLSEDFINRIIRMSDDAKSREFRQELTKEEIALRRSAIEMATARERIRAQIDLFEQAAGDVGDGDDAAAADAQQQNAPQNNIASELKTLAKNLNDIAVVAQRLFEKLSPTNRGYGGQLVQTFEIENQEGYAVSHPIMNTRIVLASLAGLLGIALLLLAAGILWHLTSGLRSARTS